MYAVRTFIKSHRKTTNTTLSGQLTNLQKTNKYQAVGIVIKSNRKTTNTTLSE